MSTRSLRGVGEEGDVEGLWRSMKRIFSLGSDEGFAESIARQIVEMIRKGYKVYLTREAAERLAPILERYGIVLVPVKRIEYPHLLIHLTDSMIYIRFKARTTGRALERELS